MNVSHNSQILPVSTAEDVRRAERLFCDNNIERQKMIKLPINMEFTWSGWCFQMGLFETKEILDVKKYMYQYFAKQTWKRPIVKGHK